jgi:hypothetical protein
MNDHQIGNGNRLTVFVVPTEKDAQLNYGDKTGFLPVFTRARRRGPRTCSKQPGQPDVPDQDASSSTNMHHLMNQDLRSLSHGFRGLLGILSDPKFDRDGSVWLGRPAQRSLRTLNGRSYTRSPVRDANGYE